MWDLSAKYVGGGGCQKFFENLAVIGMSIMQLSVDPPPGYIYIRLFNKPF